MKTLLQWAPVASGFLVLVLSMFVAVLTVSRRSSQDNLATTQNLSTKAAEQVASLSFSPASASYTFSPTATIPVGIVLDSAGKSVDGIDAVIKFDPRRAQVVGTKVTATALFEEFPQNSVDNVRGEIRFSALTFNPRPVTGIVGTFSFKALSAGPVNFNFDFSAGSTKDSNVAEHGSAKDVLGKVEDGRFEFR